MGKVTSKKSLKKNKKKIKKGKRKCSDDTTKDFTIKNQKLFIKFLLQENRLLKNTDDRELPADRLGIRNELFPQVRENYFHHLQSSIQENYKGCRSLELPPEYVHKISLEMEQHAILASIQSDIYQKAMMNVICDVKMSTKKNLLHKEIQNLLSSFKFNVIQEDSISTPGAPTTMNATMHTDDTGQWVADTVDTNHKAETPTEAKHEEFHHDLSHVYSPCESANPYFQTLPDLDDMDSLQTAITAPQPFNYTHSVDGFFMNHEPTNECPPRVPTQPTDLDSFDEGGDTGETEPVIGLEDDKERDKIAHILLGEDSLDEKLHEAGEGDLWSDDTDTGQPEEVEKVDLTDRVDKMRLIFGMEDDSEELPPAPCQAASPVRKPPAAPAKPTPWALEKYIFLYKYFKIVSELSENTRRAAAQKIVNFFGADSDDENEEAYSSEEKFCESCKTRISPWIVRYLMPYYKLRRILGRNVFKCLVKHIADSVYARIQYPDEWTVRYYVSTFFHDKKVYTCEAEVWRSQMDTEREVYG